jgi:hypothetical protein
MDGPILGMLMREGVPKLSIATQGGRWIRLARKWLAVACAATVGLVAHPGWAVDPEDVEHHLKASFCLRFLSFIEWPDNAFADRPQVVVLGVWGDDPITGAFDSLVGATVQGRRVEVRHLAAWQAPEALRQCHLLFVPESQASSAHIVLEALRGHAVLTVGETAGFADKGGMINLVVRAQRIRFELNPDAAAQVGIHFRSKLLRLADRIIEEPPHGS